MKAQVCWWLLRQKREKWDTGVLLEVDLQEHRVSTQCLLALVLYIPQGPTPFPCSSCYWKWQPTAFGNKKKHRQTLHPLLSAIWGSTCIWCLSENSKGEDRAPGLQLSKEGNVQKQPSTASLGPLHDAEEGQEGSSPCLWKKQMWVLLCHWKAWLWKHQLLHRNPQNPTITLICPSCHLARASWVGADMDLEMPQQCSSIPISLSFPN